jgi:hypothetical protein
MKKHYPDLIEIYLFHGIGVMHLKEIFTKDFIFSGTSNFTFSGLDINIETNKFVNNKEEAGQRIIEFNKNLITHSDITKVEFDNPQQAPKKEKAENKFAFFERLIKKMNTE